jgi:hypothetical protein
MELKRYRHTDAGMVPDQNEGPWVQHGDTVQGISQLLSILATVIRLRTKGDAIVLDIEDLNASAGCRVDISQSEPGKIAVWLRSDEPKGQESEPPAVDPSRN